MFPTLEIFLGFQAEFSVAHFVLAEYTNLNWNLNGLSIMSETFNNITLYLNFELWIRLSDII